MSGLLGLLGLLVYWFIGLLGLLGLLGYWGGMDKLVCPCLGLWDKSKGAGHDKSFEDTSYSYCDS